MTDARIVRDRNKAYGYRVEFEGADVTNIVSSISWEFDPVSRHRPSATIEFAIVEADFLSGRPCWVGIDMVPTEALVEEIQYRKGDEQ